ncbi:mitochondrial dihydroxy acid dehydratase [Pyronema omphalodes]|nr:mitochondrial dihydroxy acid dehydratase [Pyronema omphalodes]
MSAETSQKETSRFLAFPCIPHGTLKADKTPVLNRWSAKITNGHEFPGAQAMLYAAGVENEQQMTGAPQVGVATMWFEGNPCNMHLFDLGRTVKRALEEQGFIGWQYNTIGVSDAITMGNQGMRFSLQSREIIADSLETTTFAQHHDACIAIPGCDKNMPGCVLAILRHNRPSLLIYGGSIQPGHSEKRGTINISTCFEALGAHSYGKMETADLEDITRHACPGAGACGGMYTANTMATSLEAMGLMLPNSSTTTATTADSSASSPAKLRECVQAAEAIRVLMEKNICPRDLVTRKSLENAIAVVMVMGGSTNAVLHYLAIAHAADIDFTIDDIQKIADKTPMLADLKPSGKYMVSELAKIGGMKSVMKYLIQAKLVHGDIMTVTGKTLWENVKNAADLNFDPSGEVMIKKVEEPVKKTGHIRILKGNLAPGGAVAKITGKEGTEFTGKAMVFDSEEELVRRLENGEIGRDPNEKIVLCVRYEGPKGGPGMMRGEGSTPGIWFFGAFAHSQLQNGGLTISGQYLSHPSYLRGEKEWAGGHCYSFFVVSRLRFGQRTSTARVPSIQLHHGGFDDQDQLPIPQKFSTLIR